VNKEFISEISILLVVIATISTIFGRYFVVYDKVYPKLEKLDLYSDNAKTKIKKLLANDPEVAVLQFGKREEVHLYPVSLLRLGDVVYLSNKPEVPDYSLTYCLLCNTIHAYLLPMIYGKKIEITSNNGTVLNGNKILADKSGKLIWQQFTGEGLTSKTKNHPLQEILVKRFVWEHAITLFPESYIYFGPRKFISRMFFTLLAKMVANFDFFSFSTKKTDPRLRKKELIIGIEIDGVAKAYPLWLFDAEKISLIEDTIGNKRITIVYNNGLSVAFLESGLTLKNDILSKEDKKWKLTGESLSGGQNLKEILITEKAYWYSWSNFHPNTLVYEKSG
jgi:hypothetical protein